MSAEQLPPKNQSLVERKTGQTTKTFNVEREYNWQGVHIKHLRLSSQKSETNLTPKALVKPLNASNPTIEASSNLIPFSKTEQPGSVIKNHTWTDWSWKNKRHDRRRNNILPFSPPKPPPDAA